MKKHKSIWFAVYAVVIVIAIVAAILIPTLVNKKDKSTNNGNGQELNYNGNNNNTSSSDGDSTGDITNDGQASGDDSSNTGGDSGTGSDSGDSGDSGDGGNSGENPSGDGGNDEEVKPSSFRLNCANNYRLTNKSTMQFKEGFYTCDEAVTVKLKDVEETALTGNTVTFENAGNYTINFYTTILEASITIEVTEFNTSIDLNGSLAISSITSAENVNFDANYFTKSGNNLTANKAGKTELSTTTEEEFLTITNVYSVEIEPILISLNDGNGLEMTNGSISLYLFDNTTYLYVEANAGVDVACEKTIDVAGTPFVAAGDYFELSLTHKEDGYNATLTLTANGATKTIPFTIYTIEYVE